MEFADLWQAINEDNLQKVEKLIEINPYLIYSYDDVQIFIFYLTLKV